MNNSFKFLMQYLNFFIDFSLLFFVKQIFNNIKVSGVDFS